MGCTLEEGAETWLKIIAKMTREELLNKLITYVK